MYWIHGAVFSVAEPEPQESATVASRPKILQNNSKPAEKRKKLAGKIGGHTAAVFGQKRPKKNIL
jgi:hypothetical protein